MAGLFPIFFKTYYASDFTAQESTAWLGLCLSITGLIVALLNPFLGFLTDKYAIKKQATLFSALVTFVALLILFFTPQNHWLLSLAAFGLGLIGFNLSLSFYDSILNLVTEKSRQHQVSALGYSLGYLGGGILFLINVLMVQNPNSFGLSSPAQAIKWSFLSVALWWLIFSFPFYKYVQEPKNYPSHNFSSLVIQFHHSLTKIWHDQNLVIFLLAYWLFIDAVYTIINMATDYGTAIGLESADLIKALLLVQFLGFPFAWIAGYLTRYFNPKSLLISLLTIYLVAIQWAMKMKAPWEFWVLACLIAMAQGGVQSLSRSIFANLIPDQSSGEYFGIFNLVGRFASILGPLLIAFLTYWTQSNRLALAGLLIPLALGMFLLIRVQTK
jgi:UMF1 family MFS transporter